MSAEILRMLYDNEARLKQTETKEVPIYTTSTWTPTYYGSVTVGTTTYTSQAGYYTRVGRVILFTGYIAWTNATGTGNAQLSLPFTAANLTDGRYAVSLRINNITFANAGVEGLILPATDYVSLWTPASNVVTTAVAVEVAGDISYSGMYFI